MKNNSLTVLLVVVAATVGVPGYLLAAGCDPASGCCGTGQNYVSQQLFPNLTAPYQVSPRTVATPLPTTNTKNAVSTVRKAPVAQSETAPIVPVAQQPSGQSLEVLAL